MCTMGVSQTILRQLMEIIMDRLKGKMQNHIEIYGKPLSSKSSNRNWGDPCAFSLHAILEWNCVETWKTCVGFIWQESSWFAQIKCCFPQTMCRRSILSWGKLGGVEGSRHMRLMIYHISYIIYHISLSLSLYLSIYLSIHPSIYLYTIRQTRTIKCPSSEGLPKEKKDIRSGLLIPSP